MSNESLKAIKEIAEVTYQSTLQIGEALKSILKRVEESDNDKESN